MSARRGAPTKPDSEKVVRINVTLPPHVLSWLRAQPGGVSRTVRALVETARETA